MLIKSVHDASFKTYGRVLEGYDFTEVLKVLRETTPAGPAVEYKPSVANLEGCSVFGDLQNREYGGMPIQVGYCNGVNSKLNCFEYHRDSEINIADNDAILLLAHIWDVEDGKIDSSKTEAFLCPAGTAVEVFATSMHYAPCSATKGAPFRVIIVLPKGTNYAMPEITPANFEDKLLFASNKWLIAHPDTNEAKQGAYVGITGENIDLF